MSWRKQRINVSMRKHVARRFGAEPGDVKPITCSYCPSEIVIDWSDPERVRFLDSEGRPRPELDHVEPLSRGGAHGPDNLTPACLSCNRSKNKRTLNEWRDAEGGE